MNIGVIAAFIIFIIMGVIYGRIAGYVGSIFRFSDFLLFLIKLIRKIGYRIMRAIRLLRGDV